MCQLSGDKYISRGTTKNSNSIQGLRSAVSFVISTCSYQGGPLILQNVVPQHTVWKTMGPVHVDLVVAAPLRYMVRCLCRRCRSIELRLLALYRPFLDHWSIGKAQADGVIVSRSLDKQDNATGCVAGLSDDLCRYSYRAIFSRYHICTTMVQTSPPNSILTISYHPPE